jgi:hypothetical protein
VREEVQFLDAIDLSSTVAGYGVREMYRKSEGLKEN